MATSHRRAACVAVLACVLGALPATAGTLDKASLQARLDRLAHDFPGRIGIAVRDCATGDTLGVKADERFPEQSVFKLPVAIAVLDLVDRGRLSLDRKITLYPQDMAIYWQPLAANVTAAGWITTLDDLLTRMVAQSDNAATENILRLIGGPAAVQAVLTAKGLDGIRVDRDERHLQTEIIGIQWDDRFVDEEVFHRAIAAVPAATRAAKRDAYLADPRDTAQPAAMARLLDRLAKGELLSPASTKHLLDILNGTTTKPGRLKAGLAPGWSLGHKTGAGSTVQGMALANNDVGLLTAPGGSRYAVAVYVASTRRPEEEADAFIAAVSRAVVAAWKP
ncbi:MAG: class A beta-lactamase [Azospirillaceae bacterium]|nr:class A beta-lactamase [Azospirillaceae bacterium]